MESTKNDKTGKTILITGASRGLGLALARTLARQGWRLIIDGRTPLALEEVRQELSRSTRVAAIPGDVSDPAHRADLLQAASEAGGLDALVNNASTLGLSPLPALLDLPLEVYQHILNVNLVAPLALVQAFREQFKPNATVINLTSDAATEAYEGWGGYGSSKAGLEQLSAVLAAENPAWHIYWVDPGEMRTEMLQEALLGEDIRDRPLPEASVPGLLALLAGKLPSGRYQARNLPSTENEPPYRIGDGHA